MQNDHALIAAAYDPHGAPVRGGTDGGATKIATGMRAGYGVALSNGVRIANALAGRAKSRGREFLR